MSVFAAVDDGTAGVNSNVVWAGRRIAADGNVAWEGRRIAADKNVAWLEWLIAADNHLVGKVVGEEGAAADCRY